MTSIDSIISFIGTHRQIAYLLTFLLAAGEAIPVVGGVIPGTLLIIAIAAMIPRGTIDFWPLLSATIAGAVVGDGLSYWLGHQYQRQVLAWGPLRRRPGIINAGETFFHRHGGKSIFLARFIPGLRAVVPLFAG